MINFSHLLKLNILSTADLMDCSFFVQHKLSRISIFIENTYTYNYAIFVHAYKNNVTVSADDGDGNRDIF